MKYKTHIFHILASLPCNYNCNLQCHHDYVCVILRCSCVCDLLQKALKLISIFPSQLFLVPLSDNLSPAHTLRVTVSLWTVHFALCHCAHTLCRHCVSYNACHCALCHIHCSALGVTLVPISMSHLLVSKYSVEKYTILKYSLGKNVPTYNFIMVIISMSL